MYYWIDHREKFVENLKMVEDIVSAAEDNTLERKSQDYTGFKRFLFGSLEALDINVSDYIGQLFQVDRRCSNIDQQVAWR